MIARRKRRLICVATMTEKGYGANTNTSCSQGLQRAKNGAGSNTLD